MELRVLNYFLVAGQEGNLSTAAARLHVGQPTLSRQLKMLEQEFGQQLFVRQSHGIRLTEAGKLLLAYAEQMMRLSHMIERGMRVMSEKPLGVVSLGGCEGRFFLFLARIMKQVREECPSIGFQYTACSLSEALRRLDRGLIEFAVIEQPANIEGYRSFTIPHREQWVACMKEDNPLARKSSVTPEDLAAEPLIMFEQVMRTPLDKNSVGQWFGDRFAHLNVAAICNLSYTNVVMAREGLGTLITWEGFARDKSPDAHMVTRPLDPPIWSSVAIVWHKSRTLSAAAAYFLDFAQKYVNTLDDLDGYLREL